MKRGLAVCVMGLVASCSRSERPPDAVAAFLDPKAEPSLRAEARFFERKGSGRLRYVGLDVTPRSVRPGAHVELSHVFEVEVPFTRRVMVFVHLEDPSGRRWAVDDHRPVAGRVDFSAMRTQERWVDRHRIPLPRDIDSSSLTIWMGLFEDDTRMTLEARPGRNDGRDRFRAGEVEVEVSSDTATDLPVATALRAEQPIKPDGRLDESAWARAEVLLLSDSLGRDRATRFPTRLRLLYDEHYLYVAFEAEDKDITERYAKRDDPIYEHEAVELFLMPSVQAPQTGPYIELQASPTGVIFDASFDGPRQGMRTSYEAGQTVGTQRTGTLNDDRPDEGWISEWAVPFSRIRGLKAPPRPGDEWRMNAFRIEKYREGGQVVGEYTAWSPPRVGDFHAVNKFGRLRFGG